MRFNNLKIFCGILAGMFVITGCSSVQVSIPSYDTPISIDSSTDSTTDSSTDSTTDSSTDSTTDSVSLGVSAFELVLTGISDDIYQDPYGLYSYYGPGDVILSETVPYLYDEGATIYDCLLAYSDSTDYISIEFSSYSLYIYIGQIIYYGEVVGTSTNYVIFYNGEYLNYCVNNITCAGESGYYSNEEDNLVELLLVVNGWIY